MMAIVELLSSMVLILLQDHVALSSVEVHMSVQGLIPSLEEQLGLITGSQNRKTLFFGRPTRAAASSAICAELVLVSMTLASELRS
jgi:hypothetical protein